MPRNEKKILLLLETILKWKVDVNAVKDVRVYNDIQMFFFNA